MSTIFRLMLLWAIPLILFLWIKLYISYERNHVENIDTSFLTDDVKNKLSNIWILLKNNNIHNIEVVNNQIQYFDFKNNIIFIDTLPTLEIDSIFKKYNIKYISSYKDEKWDIVWIRIIF